MQHHMHQCKGGMARKKNISQKIFNARCTCLLRLESLFRLFTLRRELDFEGSFCCFRIPFSLLISFRPRHHGFRISTKSINLTYFDAGIKNKFWITIEKNLSVLLVLELNTSTPIINMTRLEYHHQTIRTRN